MNKKWILSGFTDEYAPEFSRQVEAARKFGMDGIEMRFVDGISVAQLTREQVLECDRQLRDNGVAVCAIGSPLGKFRLDDDMDAHMETSRRVFEYANILGAKNIRMFSFYAPEGMDPGERFQRTVDGLGRMLDIADECGVILCNENEHGLYRDNDPAHCFELMEHFGGRLKSVFDMGNFTLDKTDPYAAYQLLKPYIQYFHIKDALTAGAIVPPGCGEAQIHKILTEHAATVDGKVMVSLEPHLQTFSGLNQLVDEVTFENPYQYPDCETAFDDAVTKFKELIQL